MRMVGIRRYSDADDSTPGSAVKLQLGATTFLLFIDCWNLSGRDERRKTGKNAQYSTLSGKTRDATDLSARCAYDWRIAGCLDVCAALRKLRRRRSRPPVDCRPRDGSHWPSALRLSVHWREAWACRRNSLGLSWVCLRKKRLK